MRVIRGRYPRAAGGVQERSVFLQGQNIRAGLGMGMCGICRSYACNLPVFALN